MITGTITVVALIIVLAAAAKLQRDVNSKGGCPNCGTPVPMFRIASSFRQMLWGGWTCSKCSTEMDKFGNELPQT